MTIEVDVKGIKHMLEDLGGRIDGPVEERERSVMPTISQHSLAELLLGEPDLYSVKDVKVEVVRVLT